MRRSLKVLYIGLGFLFVGIGAIGVVLPVLPTTPFLLLASFFFTRGSERFNQWFMSTKLYENHLEDFLEKRSMTQKTKIKLVTLATCVLLLSAYMVKIVYFRIFIVFVLGFLYYYFIFRIKTISPKINVRARKEQEKHVVAKMVAIYCKGHKGTDDALCSDCDTLLEYAKARIDSCPFMETKTFCSNCHIQCYREDMRVRIREVMRYSGPRMVFHHPILAVRHLVQTHFRRDINAA